MSSEIVIRSGVNRRALGNRPQIEHRYGGFTITGDWKSAETHRQIRERIRSENPGWSISGYCDNSPLTQ